MNGFFAACLLILTIPFASAQTLSGVARNSEGQIVYLERHQIEFDENGLNRFIRVEYLRPSGEVFASMTSDFSKDRMIPETIFEDQRFQTKMTLRHNQDRLEFQETRKGKQISRKALPKKENMVASQGFDNFIRLEFDKIQTGPRQFEFGVLANQDFYTLSGYAKKASSPDDVIFGIRASSWVLRLFASELEVAYDAKTKRLKRFSGRSNVLSDSGKAQDVVITYEWSST